MARSVDDIFQRMLQRASERPPEPALERESSCLCQGRLYYVKPTLQGRVYEVCPRCNPRLSCPHCDGTGHLRQPDPLTGEEALIPYGCDCVVTEQRVALLNAASIPEKYMLATFSLDNVQHGYDIVAPEMAAKYSRNQAAVISFCHQVPAIIQNGPRPGDRYFLTLVGPVGTGKSHLAVCALNYLVWTHGFTGRFIDFQTLLQEIKDTYSKKDRGATTEEDLKRPLRQVEVLVIDELGKGRAESDWELEKLDDLINSRYNNGRITILTTNYLPPDLHRLAEKSGSSSQKSGTGEPVHRFWYESLTEETRGSHPAESYRSLTLRDRIGERMFDRIEEASLFVEFLGIPSFRRRMAEDFAKKLQRG